MEKPKGIDQIIESNPLEKYGLKFAGIGAEKICFETIGSTKKLVKVNTHVLRRKILELLCNKKIVSITADEEAKIDDDIEMERSLTEVFGDHVVKKGVFRFTVPISKFIAHAVLDEDEKNLADNLSESDVLEVEMLIETQPIAEELKDRERYKTVSLNTSLLTYSDFIGSKDILEALKKIEAIVDRNFDILDEPDCSETVKDVVEKIIEYTKKTGLMLDIFGPDNITIFRNDEGDWDYHLLDAVLPGQQDNWNINIKDDRELSLLRHCYTFYYSINNLAEKLGIKNTLDPEDMIYFKGSGIPFGEFPKD